VRVAIIGNAPACDVSPYRRLIQAADMVIAADGGGNALWGADLAPQVVIGDLDSLEPEALAWAEGHGAEVLRYRADKDETDLELALLLAAARGAIQIDVLGALGGRWDHGLANVALLALPELAGIAVRLIGDGQQAFLVRSEAAIIGRQGDTVSLLPLSGAAHGITTAGLHYPLSDATLYYERSRGISNVLTAAQGMVRLKEGLLLVVQPFHLDTADS
jgi:thiamine pyrophosphokinase